MITTRIIDDMTAIENLPNDAERIDELMRRGWSKGDARQVIAAANDDWVGDVYEVQDDGTMIDVASGRVVEQEG